MASTSPEPVPSPPSRLRWSDLLTLTAAAVVVRIVAALPIDYAPYTDPAYYSLVGQRLAEGHGFTIPVLYSFLEVGGRLPADPTLPVPSNGHWMPLTSLVATPFVEVLGEWLGGWRAAQVPMIVLSAALVPFTYLVGRELWGSRTVALTAAALALLAGPLLVMYPLVDNFAVFGACGAAALWCATRAARAGRPGPWLVASALAAGLATLARVDGLLLTVAPAVAWLLRSDWRPPRVRFAWGLASGLAFAVVLTPWLLRNLAVFGAAFPSAGGHTLWISTYNQQFSISDQPTLSSYLAWGPLNIVGSKLASWGELAGRTAVLLGGFFILPFAYGLWHERRRPELAPFLAYFVLMFVVMGAVFTFHAPKGAFYHSAPAWLPFAIPLAVASVGPASTAASRAWRFLSRPQTHRFLTFAGLSGALALSLAGSAVLLGQWSDAHAKLERAAAYLRAAAAPDDRVMAYDPPALYALTGNPGVAPPFDPFATIGQVVEAYQVRWVVVTLSPGQTRDPLGLWDGAAGTDSTGAHPDFLPADPAFEAPGVRVYQVVEAVARGR
jgi:4-amino-4-deoxy-L-arabinose transferase-like glycosyltransferase